MAFGGKIKKNRMKKIKCERKKKKQAEKARNEAKTVKFMNRRKK
jgi:hypothetical protein